MASRLADSPVTARLMRQPILGPLCFCSLLAIAGITRPAASQALRADSGSRVRIILAGSDGIIVGRLLAAPGDTVVARGSSGRVHRIPRERVAQLQVGVRGSRTGSTFAGIGIGLLVGGTFGSAIGPSIGGPPDAVFDVEFERTMGAILFGTVGGVTGGIVGYNRGGIRWRDVPMSASLGMRGARVSIAF